MNQADASIVWQVHRPKRYAGSALMETGLTVENKAKPGAVVVTDREIR